MKLECMYTQFHPFVCDKRDFNIIDFSKKTELTLNECLVRCNYLGAIIELISKVWFVDYLASNKYRVCIRVQAPERLILNINTQRTLTRFVGT